MDNITYSHEHIVLDLSIGKNDDDCYLNLYDEAIDELKKLREKGVTRIVDCSNRGMGFNWQTNKKVEELTGIEIINATGYYKEPFLPVEVSEKSVDELAEILINDLNESAKIIGEIGTSLNTMTELECKIFEATCKAQLKTNCIVITHTTLGTYAKEQVEFFKERNVNIRKLIISHVALAKDFDMIYDILKQGVNVAFDTIGKENYCSDDLQAEFIVKLCELGYEKQIFMSMDCTRQSHLKKNGGNGYAYLLDSFVPLLIKKGISEKSLNTIMCENFTRLMED